MSGTTDFVGVRVFSNLTATIARINTRDSTVIGMVMPAPAADADAFPLNTIVRLSTDDADQIANLGAGLAQDAVAQIAAEGVSTDILFVRVAHSTLIDAAAKLAAETNAIVGNAGLKTGFWKLLDAKGEFSLEPGILICPGYTSQRTGNVANAVATAMSDVAAKIIDCIAIVDCPVTSREDAVTYAEDFATALNVVAMYPNVICNLGAGNVTRPASPSVAAATIRRDKEAGNPYKAAWNRPLQGILGTSVPVSYVDGDTTSDANYLVQRGVGTIIEGKLLWAPYTTATDPTVVNWRPIKVIRTRRSIEKSLVRPLRLYMSEDLTPHTVTLIFQALDDFLSDLVALNVLVDYEIVWDTNMNPALLLSAGAMRVKARWAETPDLVDLQIYDEPMPEAFDVLSAAIAAALSALGSDNISVAA